MIVSSFIAITPAGIAGDSFNGESGKGATADETWGCVYRRGLGHCTRQEALTTYVRQLPLRLVLGFFIPVIVKFIPPRNIGETISLFLAFPPISMAIAYAALTGGSWVIHRRKLKN